MIKVPVTIITGFLGAGKTTLLQHLLRNAEGRRIAVIVNEFGSLGVDGDTLKQCGFDTCEDGDIVELTNGCLCCTVADDFVPTMSALLDREPSPDHIVIETSGLALPKPLLKAFGWPLIRTRTTVDGVIAVIDAPAVVEGRFADDPAAVEQQRALDPTIDHDNPLEELYEDQLNAADLIVLNKLDLIDPKARDLLKESLHARARRIPVVEAREGRVAPSILLGLNAAAEEDLDARPSHHDMEASHEHDDFASVVVDVAEQDSVEALLGRITTLVSDPNVLRVKGSVKIRGKALPLDIQAAGARVRHAFGAKSRGVGRCVVIGLQPFDAARAHRILGQ